MALVHYEALKQYKSIRNPVSPMIRVGVWSSIDKVSTCLHNLIIFYVVIS
jgi:hypothetical protein